MQDCQAVPLRSDNRPDGSLVGPWRKEIFATVEPTDKFDLVKGSYKPVDAKRAFDGWAPRQPKTSFQDKHVQLALDRFSGGFSGQAF